MSGSGAPRKMEGMESTNVWVTAMAMMKTARVVGVVTWSRVAERLMSMTDRRLTWIPGINPVMVPARIPIPIASRYSIIVELEFCWQLLVLCLDTLRSLQLFLRYLLP